MADRTPLDRPDCTLPAEQRPGRRELFRREILPHLSRASRSPDGISWEFTASPGLQASLERVVALERECCAGLEFRIDELPGGALRLRVRGPGAGAFEQLLPHRSEPAKPPESKASGSAPSC